MKQTISLKENRQFRQIYAKGKSTVSPQLVLYYRKNPGKKNRLGFTVSGKIGNAVVRNRVRRRLKEIYRLHESELATGYTIVIVARGRAVHSKYQEIETSFLRCAEKAGILRKTL